MVKIKLIYILSSGHSGSTLLNLILGTERQSLSVGELKYLKSFVTSYKKSKDKSINLWCDCGKYYYDCSFWSPIINSIDINKLYPIQDRFTKRFLFIKDKNNLKNYETLYNKILDRGPKKIIVDSSKDLTYLHFLLKSNQFNIKVIHLMRDGRAVINSHEKLGVNWLRTYFNWFVGNFFNRIYIFFKFKKEDKYLLSYDDFSKNPEIFLKEINNKFNLKIDSTNYINSINNTKFHNFGGNLMRWKKIDSIKYDQSWKKRMPKWKQWILTVLCYIPNRLWVYNKK